MDWRLLILNIILLFVVFVSAITPSRDHVCECPGLGTGPLSRVKMCWQVLYCRECRANDNRVPQKSLFLWKNGETAPEIPEIKPTNEIQLIT